MPETDPTTLAREAVICDPTPRDPRLLRMIRDDDESGVSGTGHVADVVVWHDGTVTVRWRTETRSTAVYDSLADALKIHGHGGKTRIVPRSTPFENGRFCAGLDQMENCPFGSIGGLDARESPQRPRWVGESEWPEWLVGYEFAARRMYGDDWRTCSFEWQHALTIEQFTASPAQEAVA